MKSFRVYVYINFLFLEREHRVFICDLCLLYRGCKPCLCFLLGGPIFLHHRVRGEGVLRLVQESVLRYSPLQGKG